MSWNGSDYDWIATGAGNLSNIVEDSSPQLGGDLDLNSNKIIGMDATSVPNTTLMLLTEHVPIVKSNGQLYKMVVTDFFHLGIDTTPQLGGNLDVKNREIYTSTSNQNIVLNPNGTGLVEIYGDGTTTGSAGAIKLNCSYNSHGITIQSPAHSANATYTLTLPTTDGSSGEYLKTDGSGVLSWDTPSGGGGGGNTDILTIATTSSVPTSVAQDTVKLYEDASALYMRSYRGNTAHPVFGIINSTGTQVATFFANGDLTLTDKITAKKILCEGGSDTGRIELQAPNVSDHISINAPATLSGNTDYILPEDGSSGEYLKTDGSGNLSWDTPSGGGGSDLVNDSSPELGGNLDVLTRDIVSSSNRDIDVKPNGSGKIKLVTTTGTTIVTSNTGGTSNLLEDMNLWLNNNSTTTGSSVALALHCGTDTSTASAYSFLRTTRESNTSANLEINVKYASGMTPSYYKTVFGANNDSGKVSFPKNIEIGNADTYQSIIQSNGSISADRTFTFPDASGTIALTSTSAWEEVATIDATAGNAVSSMVFTVENDYMYQFLISVQASTNLEGFKCEYAKLVNGSPDYTTFSTYYTGYIFPSSGGITSSHNTNGSNNNPYLTYYGVLRNADTTNSNMGVPLTGIYNWHQTNQRSDSGYAYTLQRQGTGWFDYMNCGNAVDDGRRGFFMHRNITTDEIVRIKFRMNAGNMFGTIRQLRSPM